MAEYYIYKITNLINGKTYIGQRKCPSNKTPETDEYMGSGSYFKKAKNKYGIENFNKVILESNIKSREEANNREKYWISEYKKIGKAEYNIAGGGYDEPLKYETPEMKEKRIKKLEKSLFKKEYKSELIFNNVIVTTIPLFKDGKVDNNEFVIQFLENIINVFKFDTTDDLETYISEFAYYNIKKNELYEDIFDDYFFNGKQTSIPVYAIIVNRNPIEINNILMNKLKIQYNEYILSMINANEYSYISRLLRKFLIKYKIK